MNNMLLFGMRVTIGVCESLGSLGRSWKVLEGLGRSWSVETFESEAPSLEVAGAPGAEIETILRFSMPTLCSVDVPI